ncbi:MAG TPA: CDP-glycerol glycerophosphotransferase family protein [Chitinophagaceae bacterium]|nr:CDP-glycerol glycerophosphotransferase family protein [Chitinophagaceae bacterium]MCC6636062.1 CDP-glycerol glycerophosphotransferase family protein [Chitinophagaceae bacterium]HMZ45211.1 CDP-glycerol glycerophosphotransferase family protein [Chitinophagaceae bacterium]HNE93793.1 CDP-glycerol glycerophosphotransferase family protein [Chitinophagaceae bacterium]HNF29026.1 CDP-glycerol glycerophosphotransferase family protein [Chitinophagaceae bacterium]
MQKKRLLITISFSFSIRYIVRTGLLEKIKAFAEPVIVLTWNEEDLIKELRNKGYEVYILPELIRGTAYKDIRKKIDYWFVHFRLKSPTKKNQDKFLKQYNSFKQNFIAQSRKLYNIAKMYLPGVQTKMFEKEKKLLISDTNYHQILKWVKPLNINAVFTVTPFHTQEDILLRVCNDLGMKMITSILSFDNITKRGWIPVNYNVYMVWNKYNFNELVRIYKGINKDKIFITGAPQFDFYYNPNFLLTKEEWMKTVGIKDATKKIILYAGGPKSLFPNEPQYLQHINDAINNNEIEGSPIVLFRCHPVDILQRWKDSVGSSNNIVFDSSWTGEKNLVSTNITEFDIKKLCSTLYYTDVHINLCSTMTVDGSAFNKPQIGPAYDDIAPAKAHLLKGMYWQEHFIPVLKVNGIALANSKQELIELTNKALKHSDMDEQKCKQVVEEIITYANGNSTQRVAAILENEI